MSDRNCVIGDKPHAADVGLLCSRHLEQIGVMLREIEEQTILLSAVPSLQQRNGARGGSLASQRAPVRLEVLVHNDPRSRPAGECPVGPACVECWHDTCTDVRSWWDAYDAQATEILSVLDVLGSWARAVRDDDERRLSWPAHVTVTTERDLLSRQLPWIAEQPWVDEFDGDLRKLLGQLKASNGTQDEKPVGRCYLPAEEGPCNGPIWLDTAMGHAHCGRCGATWDGPQLAHLQWEMDQVQAEANRPRTVDGRPMQTAAEIARDKGMTVNAVRLRLSKLRIKAQHGSYYDPDTLTSQAS